jgi:hypothetical protein
VLHKRPSDLLWLTIEEVLEERLAMNRAGMMCLLFLTLWSIAANAAGPSLRDQLTQNIRDICLAPSERGRYWDTSVNAGGETSVKLKFLGKASAAASFKKGEWEGVQQVLQSQQEKENSSYRKCVMKLTPLFLEKFVGNKASRVSPPATPKPPPRRDSTRGHSDGKAVTADPFQDTKEWINSENRRDEGDRHYFTNKKAILFYGEATGNPKQSTSQRKLNAKRAALVLAQRAAVEYLEGFTLVGSTTIKDAMAQDDTLSSVVTSFIRGTQLVLQDYNKSTDTAIAVIKVDVGSRNLTSEIYHRLNENPTLKKNIAPGIPMYKTTFQSTDANYDGLIIDATQQAFRPALINRIFTEKGQALYDPGKMPPKVLVENGCGEYTNSLDKAKLALAARGVTKPLIVSASGLSAGTTDLLVTDEDAVKIFSSDQSKRFLSEAKVAFILR